MMNSFNLTLCGPQQGSVQQASLFALTSLVDRLGEDLLHDFGDAVAGQHYLSFSDWLPHLHIGLFVKRGGSESRVAWIKHNTIVN